MTKPGAAVVFLPVVTVVKETKYQAQVVEGIVQNMMVKGE